MIKDNWWWIGDVGHWLFSTVAVLLAFYLGLRARKPRLRISIRIKSPTALIPPPGKTVIVMVHNSGSEAAYVHSIRMQVFWRAGDAMFKDLIGREEIENNMIPANGSLEFFTPVRHIIEIWESLPYWKKWIAAVVQRLPATVIVTDAGGYSYRARFHYPWTGGSK